MTTIRIGSLVRSYDWPGYPGSYVCGRVIALWPNHEGEVIATLELEARVHEGRPMPIKETEFDVAVCHLEGL